MKINITAKPNTSLANKTGGWRTYKPKTDLDKCISCGICVLVCPEGCVIMEKFYPVKSARKFSGGTLSKAELFNRVDNKEKPITDYDYCKGCGVCAEECPVRCIEMELEKK